MKATERLFVDMGMRFSEMSGCGEPPRNAACLRGEELKDESDGALKWQ